VTKFALAVALLGSLALTGACTSSDEEVPSEGLLRDEDVPEGWVRFEGLGYVAARHPDWSTLLGSNQDLDELSEVVAAFDPPPAVVSMLERMPPNLTFDVLFLGVDPDLAANINTFECEHSRNWSQAQWRDAGYAQYEELGVDPEVVASVEIDGGTYEVRRFESLPGVISVQAAPVSPGGCGYVFTLSHPPGEEATLEEFIKFLETVRFTDD